MARANAETKQTRASEREVKAEEVARRAYKKWQERGCPIGDDLRDWLEAEGELRIGRKESPSKDGVL